MVSPINQVGSSSSYSNEIDTQVENNHQSIETIQSTSRREQASRFVVGSHQPLIIGGHRVGFINQNNLTIEEVHAQAVHLNQIINEDSNIDVIYQPESGGLGVFPRADSEAIRLLRAGWDDWFNEHPGEPRLQFCAGASTVTVTAALEEYSHADLITLVAIAPSTLIPQGRCRQICYYRARGDLTSSSGSQLNPVTVVERHSESIGFFDNSFASSTFMSVIRYEWLRFSGREPEVLGSIHVEVSHVVECVVISESFEHAVSNGALRQEDIDNLYERAWLPVYPSDGLSWSITIVNSARQVLLAVDALFLMGIFSSNLRLQLYNGLCMIGAVNSVRGTVLVYIQRTRNRRSVARTLVLRTGFLDTVQAIYTPVFLWAYILDPALMPMLRIAYGILGVYLTPALLFEQAAQLISPLRGRIQTFIAGSSEREAIEVRPEENLPAARIGFTGGAQGTVIWGIAGQIIGIAATLCFNFTLYPALNNAEANGTSIDEGTVAPVPEPGLDPMATTYSALLAVNVGLSMAATVLNSVSLARMLRNRPQRELVATVDETRRLAIVDESDSDEDEERGV